MSSIEEQKMLREIVRNGLDASIKQVNLALSGQGLTELKPLLTSLGRNGRIPPWFEQLEISGVLPNLDGKTIGSVVEMLLVAVLEKYTLAGHLTAPLKINPARGVDLPDLDLGIKSPSANFCTSEPFFSPYERLIGNEHDALVLLTDYQDAKRNPPLRLSIIKGRYLYGSQIADRNLCAVARVNRSCVLAMGDGTAQRFFQFLAYVNQSDWLAKRLVRLLKVMQDDDSIDAILSSIETEYITENSKRGKAGTELLPDEYLSTIQKISRIHPLCVGILQACDDWIVSNLKNAAMLPVESEYRRLIEGKLDGEITMSFALQWRYNFGQVFGASDGEYDKIE